MRSLDTSVQWTKEALRGRPYCAVAMGGDYRGVLDSSLQRKSAHWLHSAVVAARMLPRASLRLTQVRRDGAHEDFWIDENCHRLSQREVATRITGLIVVVLDDISMSGSQLTDLLNQLPLPIPLPLILMCVPFMTAHARVAISTEVSLPLTWAPSELIPQMSARSIARVAPSVPLPPRPAGANRWRNCTDSDRVSAQDSGCCKLPVPFGVRLNRWLCVRAVCRRPELGPVGAQCVQGHT